MYKEREWGGTIRNTKYDIYYKNGNILNFNEKICFNDLFHENKLISKITLHNINCESSFKYRDSYLNYITDMLKLEDIVIGENSFTFKAYNCNIKNALVLSLIRFLYETFATIKITELNLEEKFFEPLLITGKCKYKNKLKRFCYFYKQILLKQDYFHDGHCWRPWETKIKSTKDWLNTHELTRVNNFFINE
jgi:hypothetical protein